jgi:hypothetical protein
MRTLSGICGRTDGSHPHADLLVFTGTDSIQSPFFTVIPDIGDPECISIFFFHVSIRIIMLFDHLEQLILLQ